MSRASTICGLPDENVGVPDGHKHAGHRLDADDNRASFEVDGHEALGLASERTIGHEVLRTRGANRQAVLETDELLTFSVAPRGGHRSPAPATRLHQQRVVSLCGQDGTARIGGGGHGAAVGPGLQVFQRVDDAAAKLPVGRAGAIGAVLFERPVGQTEEAGSLGRAHVTWRYAGEAVGHGRTSVFLVRPRRSGGGSGARWSEAGLFRCRS